MTAARVYPALRYWLTSVGCGVCGRRVMRVQVDQLVSLCLVGVRFWCHGARVDVLVDPIELAYAGRIPEPLGESLTNPFPLPRLPAMLGPAPAATVRTRGRAIPPAPEGRITVYLLPPVNPLEWRSAL